MTAAVLLEKFLGPSHVRSQDELVSAEGTLKRADAGQRPANHTWHGAHNFNALLGPSNAFRLVSSDLLTHCILIYNALQS